MIKIIAVSSLLVLTQATQALAAGDAHGEHAKPDGLPQLDPSSFESQAFWLTAIFALLYIYFSRKPLPEISRTIENRAERIKNDLDSAHRLKEEVASVQQSYEDSLKSSREESVRLFKETEEGLKAQSEQSARDFQAHAIKEVQALEKNIEKAQEKALSDINQVAADVATEAAEKIIGVRADAKSVKDVVKSLSKAA